MRVTDDRYAGEQARFALALRLLGHQARTHIIMRCTGFSQDRIRKLYDTYFRNTAGGTVKRHRGKSPSSIEFYVRNPWIQAEASLLAHIFAAWGLLRIQPDLGLEGVSPPDHLDFGQRFCDAYEEFLAVNPDTAISFEHAWGLLAVLTERDDLLMLDCADCSAFYVQDALALDRRACPACRTGPRQPRPDSRRPKGAVRPRAAPGRGSVE